MFCHYCHYEFYVPGDTLGASIRCPNCTATLRVEDKQLLYPCPECGGMLNVSLWMIGSVSTCPHCQKEITLSLGEESCKFFPGDAEKQKSMLRIASKKAGDVIGKYRVIRCLGIGGMGEVYLVEHTLLNTRCALKLLKSEIARQDPEMRARLLREARLASQIQHPNLIAVLDAELDENSDSCYIVMEYVDGVSIENILVDGPMLEQRSLEIIYAVAEALREAAEHKIIHRDIKPANIMLSSTGDVKLADLGIAKVESDNKHNMTLTMDNAVLGTPNYASPEQLRSSHRVDSRADIYSLGATLYHMLTGKRPFEADSVFGVMANVLEKEIPSARSINPSISVRTSDLIARMMAKKRENRPADFDELLKELESGRPKFSFPKIRNISRFVSLKNIWSFFLGVVAIAGLCVAGTRLYWYYLDRQKNALEEQEEQAQISLARRHYSRPLRPGNYISKVVRPTSMPEKTVEKPVEKTVDVQVPESKPDSAVNAGETELINALKEFDLKALKSMAAKNDAKTAETEVCLNFTRAVLRLDYARCRYLIQNFNGSSEVKDALNAILGDLAEYWKRRLLSNMSSLSSKRYGIDVLTIEKVIDIVAYLKAVKIDGLESYVQKAIDLIKARASETKNKRSMFGGRISSSPLTVRRYADQEFMKSYARVKKPVTISRKFNLSGSAGAHAAVLVLLDKGIVFNDELMNKLRDYPQYDDFTGEKAPAYDYSMMTLDESAVADLRKMLSEEKSSGDSDATHFEFDFGALKPQHKKRFIPEFLNDGVLQIDGLYPNSRLFREKYGANARSNDIQLDKELGNDFTLSIVFYPQTPNQNNRRSSIFPLLSISRSYRMLVLQVSKEKVLSFALNGTQHKFDTEMNVKMNQWNHLQMVVDFSHRRCRVDLNDKYRYFKLPIDFQFNPKASRKDIHFYNYSNGGAFRGMVKYLRVDYKALSAGELTDVKMQCKNMISKVDKLQSAIDQSEAAGIEKNVENLKKALHENNETAIYRLAQAVSKELKEKIKDLCNRERYEECEKLLKACNAAQRPETIDYWNMIGNIFYERYCEAMKNSNNRKIENIYNAWRWANRTNADQIHIVYTSFEYQFLRMNYRIARSILDRDQRAPEKVHDILKERLKIAKTYRQNTLERIFHNTCNPGGYWIAKEAVEAAEIADCSDRIISAFKKRLRSVKGSKNMKRGAIRGMAYMIVSDADFLLERAISVGIDAKFRIKEYLRFSNGKEETREFTVWEYLMKAIGQSNRSSEFERRARSIRCVLVLLDKKRVVESMKADLRNIPEIADFVLKK